MYLFVSKLKGDVKLPMIATEEDTGPFTKALLNTEPGKNLIAYREWMTNDAYVDLWARTLGVNAKSITLPADDPMEGIPEELKQELTENMAYFEEFGYEGRDDPTLVHPKDVSLSLAVSGV